MKKLERYLKKMRYDLLKGALYLPTFMEGEMSKREGYETILEKIERERQKYTISKDASKTVKVLEWLRSFGFFVAPISAELYGLVKFSEHVNLDFSERSILYSSIAFTVPLLRKIGYINKQRKSSEKRGFPSASYQLESDWNEIVSFCDKATEFIDERKYGHYEGSLKGKPADHTSFFSWHSWKPDKGTDYDTFRRENMRCMFPLSLDRQIFSGIFLTGFGLFCAATPVNPPFKAAGGVCFIAGSVILYDAITEDLHNRLNGSDFRYLIYEPRCPQEVEENTLFKTKIKHRGFFKDKKPIRMQMDVNVDTGEGQLLDKFLQKNFREGDIQRELYEAD